MSQRKYGLFVIMDLMHLIVCEKNLLTRTGLAELIKQQSPEIFVHQVSDGKELVTLIQQQDYQAVLIGVASDLEGIETAWFIKRYWPKISIYLYFTQTLVGDPYLETIQEISCILFNKSDTSPLAIFLDNLMKSKNEHYYSNTVKIITHIKTDIFLDVEVSLSRKEKQLLNLICKQYNTKEIAEIMNIKKRTIESHRKNLATKLNVKNSIGLALFAVKLGIYKI